jgi:tetratricopeptide (TPR) repeat protein
LVQGIEAVRFNTEKLNSSLRCHELANTIAPGRSTRNYASLLAELATFEPIGKSYRPQDAVLPIDHRWPIYQKAAADIAARRAMLAHREGQRELEKAWRILAADLQPDKCELRKQLAVWLASIAGDIESALDRYETALRGQEIGWQDYLRLEVLNLKLGKADKAAYWHEALRRSFPGQEYAWLHDPRKPFAQYSLAEAYGYFGLYDEAIALCLKAAAQNDWDWGRRILASLYESANRYEEAEHSLQAAIKIASNPSLDLRYRVELADLHVQMGKIPQAKSEYSQILSINGDIGSKTLEEWKNHAKRRLKPTNP